MRLGFHRNRTGRSALSLAKGWQWCCFAAALALLTSLAITSATWLNQTADYSEETIAPGVNLYRMRSQQPPLSVQVVRLLLPLSPNLQLTPELAGERVVGLETVSQMVERIRERGQYVAAAVNANYFILPPASFQGDPLGVHVQDGELISLPDGRCALVMKADGQIVMENLRARGIVRLLASTSTASSSSNASKGREGGEIIRSSPDSPSRDSGISLDVTSLNESPISTISTISNGVTIFTPRFGETTRTPSEALEVTATVKSATSTTSTFERGGKGEDKDKKDKGESEHETLSRQPSTINHQTSIINHQTSTINHQTSTPLFRLRVGTSFTARVTKLSGGNSLIPADGFVLCAMGRMRKALERLKVGDEVGLRIDFIPDLGEIVWAIGGGPRLVRSGKPSVEWQQENFLKTFAYRKHPRTAIGLTPKEMVWVTVDGRQPGYSDGMSLYELADFMIRLGCVEAMNLDGGGSTTLYARTEVVNRPSDGHERRIANALLLLNLAPKAPLRSLIVKASGSDIIAGGQVRFVVIGEDEYYRLYPVDSRQVRWQLEPPLGEVDAQGRLVWKTKEVQVSTFPTKPTELSIRAVCKENPQVCGVVTVNVYSEEQVQRLVLLPERLILRPGESRSLSVQAFGVGMKPLTFSPEQLEWDVRGDLGSLLRGTFVSFVSRGVSGRGEILARLGRATARIDVTVGAKWVVLNDFESERLEGLSCESYPPEVPVRIQVVSKPVWTDKSAVKLEYDFSTLSVTRAAYLRLNQPIGAAFRIAFRVFGDGRGHWLRGWVKDAKGVRHTLDFARRVDWIGEWREVQSQIPSSALPPFTLEAIYLVEPDPAKKGAGAIYIDHLKVERADW